MIKQKVILALLLCMLASSGAIAQLSKVKKARMYMEQLNYIGAIELYNQILEKNDNPEAKINLAEAYRKINDSENAEYWYGQVVQLEEVEPIHKLFYGQQLQRNGKCDLAREWYQAYVNDVPEDQRGQYLVQACDYEDELRTKNAGIYQINHVDFNSNLDDFSPAYFGEGLVFASERDKGVAIKRAHCWTGNPFNELFYAKKNKEGGAGGENADPMNECKIETYDTPEKYSKKLNSKFHDAAVTYNGDQSKIYFTRNNVLNGKTGKDDEGIIRLKIFSAVVTGEEWKDIEGLPFNSDEYSVAHPTLTPGEEKMYFASDMPGGFGGMDLYVTVKEGGSWGPPINLGARINTEGNEIFPYYEKSGKLYFGSDGHVGLGGLDIYYMDDKGNDEFGDIVNMGYPLNTISDDFGIIFDEEGKAGYFTSDREGGAGRDDIYSFCKSAAVMEILVYDEATKEPIPGATVVNDCTGNTMMTDSEGKITFDMKLNQCCNFAASMDEYMDNAKEGCTKNVKVGENVFVEIPLKKENIYLLEGIVVNQITGDPIEGAKVTLTNDCEEEPVELFTDASGTFEFPLAADCCYTVGGEKAEYFGSSVDQLCTKGDVDTLSAIINLNPISAPAPTTSNPIVSAPVPVTENPTPTGIVIDAETGKYIDLASGEPFTGDYGSSQIKDGKVVDGGSSTAWEVSPTSINKETGQINTASVSYLLHIYYDFDQSYIRDDATSEIQKLCNMLRENSDLVVEIGSHTDSRGSYRYNRSLSQRRAESVVRSLIECGIAEDRLVAKGYGETNNVNNCANNIPCSEREHQMNRRTEFKIIGCSTCTDDVREQSQINQNARVNECAACPF